MLPLRYQILGHLLVGVLSGWLLALALAPPPGISDKAVPFTTQSGMLAVTVELRPNSPPVIVSVDPLPAGRVSVTQTGDYTLSLLDAEGETLYVLPFRVSYVVPG